MVCRRFLALLCKYSSLKLVKCKYIWAKLNHMMMNIRNMCLFLSDKFFLWKWMIKLGILHVGKRETGSEKVNAWERENFCTFTRFFHLQYILRYKYRYRFQVLCQHMWQIHCSRLLEFHIFWFLYKDEANTKKLYFDASNRIFAIYDIKDKIRRVYTILIRHFCTFTRFSISSISFVTSTGVGSRSCVSTCGKFTAVFLRSSAYLDFCTINKMEIHQLNHMMMNIRNVCLVLSDEWWIVNYEKEW